MEKIKLKSLNKSQLLIEAEKMYDKLARLDNPFKKLEETEANTKILVDKYNTLVSIATSSVGHNHNLIKGLRSLLSTAEELNTSDTIKLNQLLK